MIEKNKLTLSMGLLYFIVILLLGLLVITEKKQDFLIPKVKEKLINYVEKEYTDEKYDFKYGKVTISDKTYTMKVMNKSNNDLYYTVNYQNKKITDTYKKDYLEGNTLNSSIKMYLNKKLEGLVKTNKNNYKNYSISYNTKLNNCTTSVKNKLIKGNYDLPIYIINIESDIKNISNLENVIMEMNNYTKKLGLVGKEYNITLNNTSNITKSMNIIISSDIIDSNINEVSYLISTNDFNSLNKYNVKCKYLN